jgi:hypothetical protein
VGQSRHFLGNPSNNNFQSRGSTPPPFKWDPTQLHRVSQELRIENNTRHHPIHQHHVDPQNQLISNDCLNKLNDLTARLEGLHQMAMGVDHEVRTGTPFLVVENQTKPSFKCCICHQLQDQVGIM